MEERNPPSLYCKERDAADPFLPQKQVVKSRFSLSSSSLPETGLILSGLTSAYLSFTNLPFFSPSLLERVGLSRAPFFLFPFRVELLCTPLFFLLSPSAVVAGSPSGASFFFFLPGGLFVARPPLFPFFLSSYFEAGLRGLSFFSLFTSDSCSFFFFSSFPSATGTQMFFLPFLHG